MVVQSTTSNLEYLNILAKGFHYGQKEYCMSCKVNLLLSVTVTGSVAVHSGLPQKPATDLLCSQHTAEIPVLFKPIQNPHMLHTGFFSVLAQYNPMECLINGKV